jgi:hypothetical protein
VSSQALDTRRQLNRDHTFVAMDFPSVTSLGRQQTVNGRWEIRNDGKKGDYPCLGRPTLVIFSTLRRW